jgi:hypothetical protein
MSFPWHQQPYQGYILSLFTQVFIGRRTAFCVLTGGLKLIKQKLHINTLVITVLTLNQESWLACRLTNQQKCHPLNVNAMKKNIEDKLEHANRA